MLGHPVGIAYPPLGFPVPFSGKCPLGTPVPLGNGFTGWPEPLGSGKGAAPDCDEKGPLGGDPDPEPPVVWVPDPPAPPAPAVEVTVTVTWTVEVTVWTAGQPLDGLPARPV